MPRHASSPFDTRFALVSLRAPRTLALVTFALLPACGDGGGPSGAVDMATAPAVDMATAPAADMAGATGDMAQSLECTGKETFTEAYAAMLSTCGGRNMCHNAAPFGAGLDLRQSSAWKNLVDVPAAGAMNKTLVVPGNSATSFLYQKVTNTQGRNEGAPMPKPEGAPWQAPDAQSLKALRCWIESGAKND